MLSFIIIIAIVGQWLYPSFAQLQLVLLNNLYKLLQSLSEKLNRLTYIQKISPKIQQWLWMLLFWLICCILYYSIQNTFFVLILNAFFYVFAIYMPMPAIWVLYKNTQFTSKNIYHKYLQIFATYGQHILVLQNTNTNTKNKMEGDNIEIIDYETYAKAIFAMWCYHFLLPLLLFCLPHGGFIAFTWIILRYTCMRIQNMYLIYTVEWLPRQFLLILSALLGYFEKCIKQAKLEKHYQNSLQFITDKDIESWLWQGVKGAINLNYIDSRLAYDEFIRFLAKLILAVSLGYIFSYFV
jgi:hypothetical protein